MKNIILFFYFISHSAMLSHALSWDYKAPAEQETIEQSVDQLYANAERFWTVVSKGKDTEPAIERNDLRQLLDETLVLLRTEPSNGNDTHNLARIQRIREHTAGVVDRLQNFLTPRTREILASDKNSWQYRTLKLMIEKDLFAVPFVFLGDQESFKDVLRIYEGLEAEYAMAYRRYVR
jgi:hypothetical protein